MLDKSQVDEDKQFVSRAVEAAIRIGTDPGSITEGLRTLFSTSDADLRQITMNGRLLVEKKFTWTRIAADMRDLYLWIAGGSIKPSFVE